MVEREREREREDKCKETCDEQKDAFFMSGSDSTRHHKWVAFPVSPDDDE